MSHPTSSLDALIGHLPKVELHVHIEGTLEPELMFALAKRNAIDLPFSDVEAARSAYQFSNLQDFLDIYYRGASVLRTEQDFFDLGWAYFQRVHQDNVQHAELFFDPQTHTQRGISIGTVIRGLSRACKHAEEQLKISSELILCFLRHLSEASALKTFADALKYREHFCGVGLDSSEQGHPPQKFEEVFAAAKSEGLMRVAHAGEEGPPAYIWGALDVLDVQRIDHGVRCLEDEALVHRLANEQVPLTVCPFSNVKLRVFDSLREHNLRSLLQRGLHVSIHSDDPAYFGGYISDNYRGCTKALGLDAEQLRTLAKNAINASFATEPRKQELLSALRVA